MKWFWRLILFPFIPLIWLAEIGDDCGGCGGGCHRRAEWMRRKMEMWG